MERQEEYDGEVDNLAGDLEDLVDDYNSDHPEPPLSLIILTPYCFIIRAEVNGGEEVYELTIDCDDTPTFSFDADEYLQEARNFCEQYSSYQKHACILSRNVCMHAYPKTQSCMHAYLQRHACIRKLRPKLTMLAWSADVGRKFRPHPIRIFPYPPSAQSSRPPPLTLL